MKKLIAILAVVAIAASLTVPAFAASISDPTPASKLVQGDSAQETTVPVFGYVGEDADITGTDVPPGIIVEKSQINVSVPVKLIWAAFESDKGAITAPTYTIKNNSEENKVAITMVSFTGTGTDNASVESKLTLNIVGVSNITGVSGVLASTNAAMSSVEAKSSPP